MEHIDNVIFISLENRSFHSILGFLEKDHSHHFNVDVNNNPIYCSEIDPTEGGDDIEHDLASTLYSISDNMGNFVLSNQKNVRDLYSRDNVNYQPDPKYIMGYAKKGSLPILHYLAEKYCTCSRWFSSIPTETYPNRSFMISAQSQSKVTNFPYDFSILYNCPTIFDRLDQGNISWKIYYKDFSDSLLNTTLVNCRRLAKQYKIQDIIHHIESGQLSNFSFLQLDDYENSIPQLVEYFGNKEKYIGNLYNALKKSEYWKNTLIVITFDEAGGFYDPITPPNCANPGNQIARYKSSLDLVEREFHFDRYGVRVPAILVSPWIQQCIDDTIYDHTSILKFLEVKFNLPPLTQRDSEANYEFKFTDTIRTDIEDDDLRIETKPNTYGTVFVCKLMHWATNILVGIGKLFK